MLDSDQDLREATSEDANYHRLAHASLLLLAGDRAGYQQFCRDNAKRFGKSDDPMTVHVLDRMCVLAPGALADAAEPVKQAEHVLAAKPIDLVNWPGAVRYALGAARYRAGQYQEAVRSCQESGQRYSRWTGTYLNWPILVLALHQQGQSQEARNRWLYGASQWLEQKTQGRAKDDLSPPANVNAVNWLEFQVLYREAEGVLNAPHRREAEAALSQQKWADALPHLDALLAKDPDFRPDREDRGACLAWLGRWDKAVADFARMVEQQPDDPYGWYYLAAARLGAGDRNGSQKTAAEMQTKWKGTTDVKTASRLMYTVLTSPPPDWDAAALLGVAQTASTDWQGNIRVVAALLVRAGKDAEALERFEGNKNYQPRAWDWLFQAMAHIRLGHIKTARECLKKADEWAASANRQGQEPDTIRASWDGWYEPVETKELRRQVEDLLKAARDDVGK